MIYCTLLNPALDCIYTVDAFASGSTLLDVPLCVVPAGKGINVAAMVKALGEEACVVGIIPEEAHGRFTTWLDRQGIGSSLLTVPGEVRMNVTLLEKGVGVASHINSAGPEMPEGMGEEFLLHAEKHMVEGDLWCFSGSLASPGPDADLYARLIKACKAIGIDTFLDTRGKR